ncbi:MAG: chemotaxis protein CheR [Micavibrio sp.]|nr:chemotaxis protein CheR [Micavibrio sp.]|tara:strand:- start:244 stop:1122 length:879 start_codon:yes stop_codon:yes gene_type:complete
MNTQRHERSTPSTDNNEEVSEQLSQEHFHLIKTMLYDTAGITLADHKRNMAHNRIAKRIKELNIPCFDDYISYLNKHQEEEISNLVNALTTNVTHFFREQHHFEHIKQETAALLKAGQTKIRIWSAGCSIGAEPYSTAITLYDLQQSLGIRADIKILATDIDTTALETARNRKYPERNIKGLSKEHLNKHFTTACINGENFYKLKDHVRNMVSFNYLNLNETKWPMKGPFDFIFCRNVFIYFDREKQLEYVDKMTDLLKTGGYLLLGHSEHFAAENVKYKTCGQTTYQKISD